ncbi:MAG: Gfo/Idh/MocA family oxidoreductase [Planctomycetia bacterium]|nr:Gfo/Idh/MocA family oxidoreductase [Planctomycetia bacterium]
MNALNPAEKAVGRTNFQTAIGSELTRREFLVRSAASGAVGAAGMGAFYFGYTKMKNPLPIGIIGTGDEGGVLIGALNPDYVDVVAIADIRPYNIHRALHGDQSSPSVQAVRPGLMAKYGYKSEDEAKKHIKVSADYKEMLADPNIKGVIIALPLHLHHSVAIEAMNAGKHVLTEKLMGQTVGKCKSMGRVANQKKLHLATGHQRHYSILYDNAVDVIKRGLIGDLHHIRAQWHRRNLPGRDSWQPALPNDKMAADLLAAQTALKSASGSQIEALQKKVTQLELLMMDKDVDAGKYGYVEKTIPGQGSLKPYVVSPLEELIRWRLWARTGAGLMAELGSHQLDAAGIFCSAQRKDGKKAKPLNVSAVGVRSLFANDREVDDHVHCNFEFPGLDYDPNDDAKKQKKTVVSYSSINGNPWGGYGEVVMGTKGTIILELEQDYGLFPTDGPSTFVDVVKSKDGGAVLDTTSSAPPSAAAGEKALEAAPPSKGYREEIEHWAWCIENFDFEKNKPKCHPEVAMSDAIIALTTNIAIRDNKRIEFKPEWFDINSDETPEGEKPEVKV